jgi:hypothetical protein
MRDTITWYNLPEYNENVEFRDCPVGHDDGSELLDHTPRKDILPRPLQDTRSRFNTLPYPERHPVKVREMQDRHEIPAILRAHETRIGNSHTLYSTSLAWENRPTKEACRGKSSETPRTRNNSATEAGVDGSRHLSMNAKSKTGAHRDSMQQTLRFGHRHSQPAYYTTGIRIFSWVKPTIDAMNKMPKAPAFYTTDSSGTARRVGPAEYTLLKIELGIWA